MARMTRSALASSPRPALALLGFCAALSVGCHCDSQPAPRSDPGATRGDTSASAGVSAHELEKPRNVSSEASTFLEWPESAYHAKLTIEDGAALLVTPTAAIRVSNGKPAEKMALPFGHTTAIFDDSIVYWHDGAIRAVTKAGEEPRTLAALEQEPVALFGSMARFGWLARSSHGAHSLHTLQGRSPRELYQTAHAVVAATMREDWVFFVERLEQASWRAAGLSTIGHARAFSKTHGGRAPSMLATGKDGIYFYDGPTRSVRRLSPDLAQETVLAEGVICSPLAVSDRVVCGHVEGVFEIPHAGATPRILSVEKGGPIAAIAADETHAAWLVDSGSGQLRLRWLELPKLGTAPEPNRGALGKPAAPSGSQPAQRSASDESK